MLDMIKLGLHSPWRVFSYGVDKFFAVLVRRRKGVSAQDGLVVRGWPVIDIRRDCRLVVGSNVTLNSRNRGYHINMHSPVKILADRSGAVISIGAGTRIHGTCIHAYESIRIGRNCLIAANTQIFDGNGHDLSLPDAEKRIETVGGSRPVLIEDNVWIGANCIILPGVRIGEGSVISAGSVVSRDIPSLSVAAGNPAIVIRSYRA